MSKKGKFSQSRRSTNAELEQAFEAATAAANSDTVYQDPGAVSIAAKTASAKKQTPQQKKILVITFSVLAVILLAVASVGTWWYLDTTEDDGLIYSNVSAMGIDLSGMTQEEAAAAIGEQVASYTQENLVLQFPDFSLILSPSETQAHVDVEKLVADAYTYGRTGTRWENYQFRTTAQSTSYALNVSDYLVLDTGYIQEVLEEEALDVSSELVESTVYVTGDMPELDCTYAQAIAKENVEHQTLCITLGTPYRSLDVQGIYTAILSAYMNQDFSPIQVAYIVTEPQPLDLQYIFEEYCVAPVDAILDESNYSITSDVAGYGFAIEELQAALDACEYGETLEFPMNFLSPDVTKADLEEKLFVDVLASVSTKHVNNSNRTTNLKLACQAINGTILKPGQTFSFNRTVGERTAAKGYKGATVYVGGASVEQLGGGICQVASTIYYAALLADMKITERTEHMYSVDYVPLGMDATVYWGSLDFKFTNNTDYPVRIEAWVSGGQVHVKLIGTDTKDYYVKMIYEVTDGPNYPATKYKVYAKDNEEGYKDGETIQTSYTGRSVKSYRCYYSKATNRLLSTNFEDRSTYAKRDKIICIIGDPTAPTDEDGRPIETTTEEPTTTATTQATTEATTGATTEATAEASDNASGASVEESSEATEESTDGTEESTNGAAEVSAEESSQKTEAESSQKSEAESSQKSEAESSRKSAEESSDGE